MKPLPALIALSLVLCATGCAAQPAKVGAQAQASADAIVTHVNAAQQLLGQARPHADTIGATKIDAANQHLTAAVAEVTPLRQAIQTLTDTAVKFQNLWNDSWFGGKAHALFWGIVGIFFGLLVLGVAGEFLIGGGASGILSVIRLAMRELAGAVPLFGGRFMAWAKNREHALALEAAKVEAFFTQK